MCENKYYFLLQALAAAQQMCEAAVKHHTSATNLIWDTLQLLGQL